MTIPEVSELFAQWVKTVTNKGRFDPRYDYFIYVDEATLDQFKGVTTKPGQEGKGDEFVNDDVVAIVVEADRLEWKPGHSEDMDEDDEDDKMWQCVRPDAVAYLYDLLTQMTKFWKGYLHTHLKFSMEHTDIVCKRVS
ncbi:hypothetical protein SCAR479_13962 [Seiridium cardinale]|uniref:Uncharacterized protein n=1 Tax=Seiridium cardinale TaxID=138064 RepID=A0ABR2X6I7_9PEZI